MLYLLLLFIAIIPGVVLMTYIYFMDRVEKEPLGLIFGLLGLGALSCLPAALLEVILEGITPFSTDSDSYFSIFMASFFIVALVEECCKFTILKLVTWNQPAFSHRFDGIVYSVAVSIGFATLENILYVFESGLGTGIMRAITAVPGHMFFAIFMGAMYGVAKYQHSYGKVSNSAICLMCSLLFPILIHGFYDFALFAQTLISILLVIGLLISLYIGTFCFVIFSSKNDEPVNQNRWLQWRNMHNEQ